MNNFDYSLVFRALGDLNRLQIIEMLADGEKCACKILEEFEITQPTLSHHMKILCDCSLVNVRKQGKWSHYSLNKDITNSIIDFLITIKKDKAGDN